MGFSITLPRTEIAIEVKSALGGRLWHPSQRRQNRESEFSCVGDLRLQSLLEGVITRIQVMEQCMLCDDVGIGGGMSL